MTVDVEATVTGNAESELEDEFTAMGEYLLTAAALAAYNRWVALASERLTKTRDPYVRALRLPVVDGREATITLGGTESADDQLANWIENGLDAYNMRDTHLKGAPSRVIRFEHEGAGAGPRKNASPSPLGPADEKQILQRLRTTGGHYRWGQRPPPGALPQKYDRAVHAGGSTYYTYRTISANSPAGSWMNPGIDARHLMDQVQDELPEIIMDAVARALESD